MSDEQIEEMLTDIIAEVDYDLYKSIYIKECQEEPDLAQEIQKNLIDIVKKHLK